jgi:hypothetical protein
VCRRSRRDSLKDIFNTNVLITADQETKIRRVFGQADWRLARS